MPQDNEYGDLEIGIYQFHTGAYDVDLRLDQHLDPRPRTSDDDPHSGEILPQRGTATFDLPALKELHLDPVAYGKLHAKQLFADPALLAFWQKAKVRMDDRILRVRLLVGPSASAL